MYFLQLTMFGFLQDAHCSQEMEQNII